MEKGPSMTRKKVADFEIGGICVKMTEAQAARWNNGDITTHDLNTIIVSIPEPQNQARYITLRRATNTRLEKKIANTINDSSANRCGNWKDN